MIADAGDNSIPPHRQAADPYRQKRADQQFTAAGRQHVVRELGLRMQQTLSQIDTGESAWQQIGIDMEEHDSEDGKRPETVYVRAV